jgi:uncharacterized membrane protein YhaH (DUF805 family)
MGALIQGLVRALDFRGRLGRREYWKLVVGLLLLDATAAIVLDRSGRREEWALSAGFFMLFSVLAVTSATIRRLHDTDRRWVSILIAVIPLIGPVLLLVWLCRSSAGAGEVASPGRSGAGIRFADKVAAWSLRGTPFDSTEYEAIRQRHGGWLERTIKSHETRMANRAVLSNVIACPQCGTSTSYPSHVGTRSHDCPYCRTRFSARYNEDGTLAACWK